MCHVSNRERESLWKGNCHTPLHITSLEHNHNIHQPPHPATTTLNDPFNVQLLHLCLCFPLPLGNVPNCASPAPFGICMHILHYICIRRLCSCPGAVPPAPSISIIRDQTISSPLPLFYPKSVLHLVLCTLPRAPVLCVLFPGRSVCVLWRSALCALDARCAEVASGMASATAIAIWSSAPVSVSGRYLLACVGCSMSI